MQKAESSYNGMLAVFKEEGFTSNDVVAKLRGILHMKKIGHTGTLDPAATGVLPVCLGKGTKMISLLEDTDKTYRCKCKLGVLTDTEDMTGNVVETGSTEGITKDRIIKELESFKGRYMQVPPMYSAKKVNGRKLYELAREGVEIERKPCEVFIKSISADSFDLSDDIFEFTVECSKGTYIRSLCRDLGERLGTKASMLKLVRTKACGISISDALKLSEIEELAKSGEISKRMISIDKVFSEYDEIRAGNAEEDKSVRNGNVLRVSLPDGRYRVYLSDGTFAAIYEVRNKKAQLCGYFLTQTNLIKA
ncbi:MAG: tRNA pseudouridine(55) synthase TruB [Lachnospiraceae bacterium]|nr:tRNA pseudouridine(55) synthase TruB [Lachnospiraceae bacterium]